MSYSDHSQQAQKQITNQSEPHKNLLRIHGKYNFLIQWKKTLSNRVNMPRNPFGCPSRIRRITLQIVREFFKSQSGSKGKIKLLQICCQVQRWHLWMRCNAVVIWWYSYTIEYNFAFFNYNFLGKIKLKISQVKTTPSIKIWMTWWSYLTLRFQNSMGTSTNCQPLWACLKKWLTIDKFQISERWFTFSRF